MGNEKSEDQIPNTPPQEQFNSEVLPSYEAYMRDMGTIWKARCAAYMVGHFAEHVHKYYKYHDRSQLHGKTGKAENFVKYLAKKHCPELKIVWDVALASKHRFLKKKAKSRTVTADSGTFSQVIIATGIGIHSATGVFSERSVEGPTGSVVADADSERLWMPDCDRYFDDVLEKAVGFWKVWLETAPSYP